MNIKDLKVGDKVFIREDLEHGARYGSYMYINAMGSGIKQIQYIYGDEGFSVVCGKGNRYEFIYHYTPEMVDWEKTRRLKLNESWENIKKVISGDSIFKEIIQSGENGNEVTEATTYDGKVIVVKNNNEENDIEKAVMLLMLKQLGVTYGDIKREVEKVKIKWVPQLDEKYYYINTSGKADFLYWKGHSIDTGRLEFNNCFETRKEAEEKLEKIKEVLKGDYDGK